MRCILRQTEISLLLVWVGILHLRSYKIRSTLLALVLAVFCNFHTRRNTGMRLLA